jgi:NAD(P)-dependent dehydrogenase (short-subunit alcohol dehydrogenase family)
MTESEGALAGAHVVVVGGSSGMGLAVVAQAAAAGAKVTIMGRDQGKLGAALAQTPGAQGRTIDLRNAGSIAPAMHGLGSVDHLVITAGTFGLTPIAQSGPDDWRGVLEERLIGPLSIIKALGAQLTSSIVWFTGTVAGRPSAGSAIPAAGLGGVEAAMRALALELAPIRVNVVRPGSFDTPLMDGLLGARKAAAVEQMSARLPVRRIGAPDDAAQAAMFLMTNPFMTGEVVQIDGGAHLV